MKRIKFILLAIAMLLAAPAFLTSCQEDAPEINYTMNVSVINDFTKVVEAINNGSLKNEQAIAKLTEAIDKMNADQQAKLQAIIDVLNSVNATLETKLALIEAAIKAQTLSMETKLDLLEQAIKAMPDYSDKFDAVVDALNAMKTQIEALGTGQTGIATQIGNVTTAINNLIAEVKSGNKSEADALAEIIKKLEELKAAIGSGGGSGGGGSTPSTMEYVELSLPSGLLWAKCNLGASKPSDFGDYYAWGETEPKDKYAWSNYKWMQAGQYGPDYITKYTKEDGNLGGIWYTHHGWDLVFIGDGKTTLDPEDDAATAKLGSPWRMPTKEDIKELIDYCTWTWTTQDGVNGYEVKGTNGNSIFLPAAGIYSGETLSSPGDVGRYGTASLGDYNQFTKLLLFNSASHSRIDTFRFYGCTIRPVRQ